MTDQQQNEKPPFLTSNDLALAQAGAQHAYNWWLKQPGSKTKRERLKAFKALNDKLDEACDHLNPYDSETMPADFGNDPIYGPLTKAQQRRAKGASHD